MSSAARVAALACVAVLVGGVSAASGDGSDAVDPESPIAFVLGPEPMLLSVTVPDGHDVSISLERSPPSWGAESGTAGFAMIHLSPLADHRGAWGTIWGGPGRPLAAVHVGSIAVGAGPSVVNPVVEVITAIHEFAPIIWSLNNSESSFPLDSGRNELLFGSKNAAFQVSGELTGDLDGVMVELRTMPVDTLRIRSTTTPHEWSNQTELWLSMGGYVDGDLSLQMRHDVNSLFVLGTTDYGRVVIRDGIGWVCDTGVAAGPVGPNAFMLNSAPGTWSADIWGLGAGRVGPAVHAIAMDFPNRQPILDHRVCLA